MADECPHAARRETATASGGWVTWCCVCGAWRSWMGPFVESTELNDSGWVLPIGQDNLHEQHGGPAEAKGGA